jgi:hypothetical protein
MYKGGAGGYTFYVRGGEQVIRQRKNNSNYGDTASRTMSQMIRRVRWGNLVNVFKSQKSWQPKAYDSKTKGQTDYNIFMQLNINRATVALTKEMCEAGCAVLEGYQVSRGSLPPIALSNAQTGNQYVSDIKLTNAISGSTTVGQLAADIIANNPQFTAGDNIAFIFFKNWKTSRTEWPYVATSYTEITLDASSTTVVNSIPELDNRLSKSTGGYLQVSWSTSGEFEPTREVGFVAIHTRKSASMLAVSTQEILMNSQSIASTYSGSQWEMQCVLSYGLTDDVPLDPSFPEASISSVTANGSAVVSGSTLEGSQELTIFGTNLSTRSVVVTFNETVYTPLDSGDGYMTFIIGNNGSVRISLNGRPYMNLSVTGIEVPEGLPTTMRADLYKSASDTVFPMTLSEAYCANYPHVVSTAYPRVRLRLGSSSLPFTDVDSENYVGHNCTFSVSAGATADVVGVVITPTDSSAVAWLEWKGFIICVTNYTT